VIQVSLFAAFAEFIGARRIEVPHHPGMTCADLWEDIRKQHPKAAHIPALFAIRDEYVPAETLLKDGDQVMLFPPVSGGEPRYIYEEPLSVERAIQAVRDEDGGGEAIFTGRVRRHSEGRTIRHLFYECQVTMAEKEIAKIISEMHGKWPLKRIHIEHRIGKLEVGDMAVIVAVSAEHRAEAMVACRYGIDELKHRVPIWKKEVSMDGEVWVGACSDEEHGK
jgi:molybdopterin synthase catalytic subunit